MPLLVYPSCGVLQLLHGSPFTNLEDEAEIPRRWDEVGRTDPALLWMLPSQ